MIIRIGDITENTYQYIRDLYDEGIRDFEFHISSYGGDLLSGFKIYDLMRSDKENKVKCVVEGECYSSATIVLLSAPYENRIAFPNSSFLIHSPLLPYVENVNKYSIESIKNEIESSLNQLKSIYGERTKIGEMVDYYIREERTFYPKEAMKLGFISQIERLQNKNTNKLIMKKEYLKNLINSIVSQLKNEILKTKNGEEIEVVSLEIGSPVSGVEDGVYELEDETILTIEGGVIVDIATKSEEVVENNEEVVDEEKVDEIVEETTDEIVETIETTIVEEEEIDENEIKELIEIAVEEVKKELIDKYQPLVKLINDCGGVNRLKSLKKVKNEKKNFKSEVKNQKRGLRDLMNL